MSKRLKVKNLLISLLIVYLISLCFIFCNVNSVEANVTEQKKLTVGVAMIEFKHPFWGGEIQAAKDAGEKYGWDVIIRDCGGDAAIQTDVIERFITQKVDLIILPAVEKSALVAAVKAANDAGIPLLTVNRGIIRGRGAKPIAYVGADDYTGGRLQAEMVKQLLGKEGNIITFECRLGSGPQVERHAGLVDGLGGTNIEILKVYPTHGDREKALAAMQDSLLIYPKGELDALVCHSSEEPEMLIQAIKAAGRDELIGKIIAFDFPSYIKAGILNGNYYGTVLQDPYLQMMLCMDMAWMQLSGSGVRIPDPFFTPLVAITAENVKDIPPSW